MAEEMPWWLLVAWRIYYHIEPWDVQNWANGYDWNLHSKNRPKLAAEKAAELMKAFREFTSSGSRNDS